MKHAEIAGAPDDRTPTKTIEAGLTDESRVFLRECGYTADELERFRSGASDWILQCRGSRFFLADSDSGEDAQGYYRAYFEMIPEKAVFEKGEFVGLYLCAGDFRYSGNDRASFRVDRWGYPGDDPFSAHVSPDKRTHVFLFSNEESHQWGDWTLLRRDPEKEYGCRLDF